MSTVLSGEQHARVPLVSSLRIIQLRKRAAWLLMALPVLGLSGYAWAQGWFGSPASSHSASLIIYQVEPRDLPISVIERGNLESQINQQVFCEVDDYRSDGVNGTTIIWVIANGSSVSQGDLICELDSSAILTALDEQVLDTEEARSGFIQAQANLENQTIQNQTAEDKAILDVALAELELKMFEDVAKGSHILAIAVIERQIDDLNNEILAAEMSLTLKRNEKVGIESLFKLGYAGKSEMDRSVLSYLQAEGDYAAKLNKLQTQMASLEKLDSFDRQMKVLELEGKKRTTEQELKQTLITNQAKMAQMQGLLATRTEQLKKEEERLDRYKTQMANCKIYAPQDGMVAYASSREVEIAEGVAVRPRQHILSIPNLRTMQVQTSVHESALDRVQPGLKTTVTIDAFPDRSYSGTVKSVAVLPDRSYYSDTKTYATIVTIDEEVYQIKPGMTAVCEINVEKLTGVNAVPIQAVVQRDGSNWLYVENNGTVDRRMVSLGISNDQFIAITDGIEVGDQVVLNPGAVVDKNTSRTMEAEKTMHEPAENLVASTEDPIAIN